MFQNKYFETKRALTLPWKWYVRLESLDATRNSCYINRWYKRASLITNKYPYPYPYPYPYLLHLPSGRRAATRRRSTYSFVELSLPE